MLVRCGALLPRRRLALASFVSLPASSSHGHCFHTSVVEGNVSDELAVVTVPVLKDNYSYIVVHRRRRPSHRPYVSVIDPGESDPIARVLDKEQLAVDRILLTHHHADHVGGVVGLLKRDAAGGAGAGAADTIEVVGPAAENDRLADVMGRPLTRAVVDGDILAMGTDGPEFRVLATPCHTAGHVTYLIDGEGNEDGSATAPPVAFTGDTLFVAGCGRFFEGDARQMFASLQGLQRELRHDETSLIFCGHEYTESNLEFALALEPGNGRLEERLKWAQARRAQHLPTVPSTLGDELRTNPFLRLDRPLAKRLGFMEWGSDENKIELLHALRLKKDQF